MSPVGEEVNPNPGDIVHHQSSLIISRLALEGARVEVVPDKLVEGIRITVSAASADHLRRALGRLSVEFALMRDKV